MPGHAPDPHLRPWAFGAAALLVMAVVLVLLTGAGPDVPGPPVREWLGLSDKEDFKDCTPDLVHVKDPRRPPPPRGQWRREPAVPEELGEMAAVSVDGRVYVGTGLSADVLSSTNVHLFDPSTRTYEPIPDSPEPLDHTDAVAWNGDLYLVGGFSNGEASDNLWRYSVAEGSWTELASMPTARGAAAAGVIGDRLYVVGGTPQNPPGDTEPFGKTEVYDFRSDSWSTAPAMPIPRHHLAATVLADRLYVAGGRLPGEFSSDAFFSFDPATGRWQPLAPLPQGVGGTDAVTAAGMVVVVGGGDELGTWVTPAAWSYDPAADSWQRLPDLGEARHVLAAAAVGDRVYVFGGAPCAGNGTFDQTRTVESLSVG